MKWCIESKDKLKIGSTREVLRFAWIPKHLTYQGLPYKIWLEHYIVTEIYTEGGDGGTTHFWKEIPHTRCLSYYLT